MTATHADLAGQARRIILDLLDAIQTKGATEARTATLLRAVETETRCRRPGCDDYVKRAARSYIAGLLNAGDYDTIRARYSKPVKVEPARLPEPDHDSYTPRPPHRPVNPAHIRPTIVRQPAPQPYQPTQRPARHPVSQAPRPRHPGNALRYVAGLLLALR